MYHRIRSARRDGRGATICRGMRANRSGATPACPGMRCAGLAHGLTVFRQQAPVLADGAPTLDQRAAAATAREG